MKYGTLTFTPAQASPELLAQTTYQALKNILAEDVLVAPIDAGLADTAAFCETYQIGLDVSANCVIVQAKRADRTWYAAVMILATTKADVNKVIKKHLDARKISFAPMDIATELTGMEYGGINPIGLPNDWPILIDSQVAAQEKLVIGSGIRASKLLVKSSVLTSLPNAEVMDLALPD